MSFDLNLEPKPDCYGKVWNSKDPACAGGADITYRDEKTGSHLRPPCDHYASCGARTAHTKFEQSRLVPAQNLVRPPASQQPTAAAQPATPPQWMSPAQMQAWMNDQAKTMATKMFDEMRSYGPQRGTTPYGTPSYPQGTYPQGTTPFYDARFQPMPVNYQMPAYLTVPEVRYEGDSLFGILVRTVFRSVMKAGGHSFSHFWDTMPMRPPPGGTQ